MWEPVVRMGSQGEAVKTLQVDLAAAGFDTGGADGDFGLHTDAALRAFQQSRHLTPDGVAGPVTWAALQQASTPVRPPAPPPATPPTRTAWSLSPAGAQFIARFEGVRTTLYNDPHGNCTIGCGHLVHVGHCNGSEPTELLAGITQERAFEILAEDAAAAAAAVSQHAPGLTNQHQFDALVSFCFNVGAGRFTRSDVGKLAAGGELGVVPEALATFQQPGSAALPGVAIRRQAEAKLFQDGVYA